MAFVAVALFSCEGPTTKTSFTLTYGDKEIANGDVIDVTMDHYEWGEMVAHVFLKNNGSASTFTVKEVRNYDFAKYKPAFCFKGNCVQANGEKEQLWEVGEIDANVEEDLAMHLFVIDQESANCPGVFTVSNGTESIEFTLNFVYEKEAIPAE